MQGFFRSDMNFHAQQVLEILNQTRVIHQAAARFPRNQQIEVAVFIGLAAGHGTKHAQAVRAAPPGEI